MDHFIAARTISSHRCRMDSVYHKLLASTHIAKDDMSASHATKSEASNQLLPPEVAAKTGALFGRARSYPIFSGQWYRYRSLAFAIGSLLVCLILMAVMLPPAMRKSNVIFDWDRVVSVCSVYLIPAFLLFLSGPGLAVLIRKRHLARIPEALAMFAAMIACLFFSVMVLGAMTGYYQAQRYDAKTDMLVAHSLPSLQITVNLRGGHTTRLAGQRGLAPPVPDPGPEVLAAYERVRKEFGMPEQTGLRVKDSIPLAERLAVEDMKRLDAGDPTIGKEERRAIFKAYVKALRDRAKRSRPDTVLLSQVTERQRLAGEHYNEALAEWERRNVRPSPEDEQMAKRLSSLATTTTGVVVMFLMLWAAGLMDLVTYVRQRGRLTDVLEKQELRREQDARTSAEMRLSVLAAQVEPHFLFNTLASVRSAIATDPQRATHIVDHMVDYLRSTIPQMRGDAVRATVPLASQLDSARAYLALMHERIPRLAFSVASDADLAKASIPPLMLISLVENAVKHGIEPKIGPARIEVRARRVDDGKEAALEVTVADDGVGFGNAVSGDGIGLANIQERLRSQFGASASLTLKALPEGGVAAILRLPLAFES